MPSPPRLVSPLAQPFDVTLADLPGSKSITNRALLLAALADGTSTLTRTLLADDSRVMLAALRTLGFAVEQEGTTVTVAGRGGVIPAAHADLHLGNAGTATRFLTAACCLAAPGSAITIDGVERMRQRPIGELVDALHTLGAAIDYLGAAGFPPLRITGRPLQHNELTLRPTASSQFISALLHVAPLLPAGLTLHFDGPVTSRPYVEMTLAILARFGVRADVDAGFTRIAIAPQRFSPADLDIEPDASNASYFLAAATLVPGSRCVVEGLGFASVQGDVWFAERVLQPMGASVIYERSAVIVRGGGELRGIDIDLGDLPDMAQTLAPLALHATGDTTIRNIGNLRVKETDRLAALQAELTKCGATATIDGDDLHITPPAQVIRPAAGIDTYDDHRMAMGFAVAGLRGPAPLQINDPTCVNKTFPEYWDFLARLGEERHEV